MSTSIINLALFNFGCILLIDTYKDNGITVIVLINVWLISEVFVILFILNLYVEPRELSSCASLAASVTRWHMKEYQLSWYSVN